MMRNLILFILLISVAACQPPASKKAEKKEIAADLLVSCEGIGSIKLADTYDDIVKKVGKKAVNVHENTVSGKYISIWENEPKQLNVFFEERNTPFKRVKYIQTIHPNAPYMTVDSLKAGMLLRDMVAKNGYVAITFRNFYAKEESGLIVSFNDGNIPKKTPCLQGIMEWSSQSNVYKDDMIKFQKQEIVQSFDKIFNRMEVVLANLRVSNQNK